MTEPTFTADDGVLATAGGHGYAAKKFFSQMPQMPKAFSVRIFKGPAMSGFPYSAATTAQFDVGYRPGGFASAASAVAAPMAASDPRQTQSWLPQRQVNPRLFPGFALPSTTTTITSNIRTYESRNPAPAFPPYSIYPDLSKDTYIYERSDTYSISEADESSAPSSLFSPALSVDSTTTIKSSESPERPLSRANGQLSIPTAANFNPSSIHRQASSGTSNALSIVRVGSSRGTTTSVGNSSADGSLSVIPPTAARPRTPNPPSRPPAPGPPPSNPYTNGYMPTRPMSRSQSRNTWDDYVEESILDQSSELARMNASLNARASAMYSQENSPLDHNDYQAIPQVPLPPDDPTQYASVMSSSPESYYATAADSTPRRTGPITTGPQPRRTSPQQDHVSTTSGTLIPYQASIPQQQQQPQPDLFIPPMTRNGEPGPYFEAGSYNNPNRPSSQAFTGVDYSRNTPISSVSSGRSSSSNGSRTSPPIPPQITRSNVSIIGQGTGFPSRQDQDRPLPIPPSSAVSENHFSFPSTTMPVATFPTQRPPSRGLSVSPPVPQLPEGIRTRKDSLAVEAARNASRRYRTPSSSPPIDDSGRRPDPVIITNGMTLDSSPTSARSPTNPTWSSVSGPLAQNPQAPRLEVSDRQAPATTQAPAIPINSTTATTTTTSRRPIPGPRRMNSDPVPTTTVNDVVPPMPPPQRRHTDTELPIPSNAPPSCVTRSRVRWCERLVCPSPLKPGQRRKGWFNRRGDQLWTNEGAYKPPPQGEEYPIDLDSYPDYGQGWMNEEGTRIDMEHRLVPKAPLRSALKQTQAT